MKRISLIILPFIVFAFLGCGEDLHFKEGAAQESIKGFLQNVQDGNQDKAFKYVMKSLKEDKTIQNFINNKIESFEIVKEYPSLNDSPEFKSKIESAQIIIDAKNKEDYDKKIKKIEDMLKDKVQPEFFHLVKEKYFAVKVTENGSPKNYIITYFSAQNLNNITGIILVNKPEIEADMTMVDQNLAGIITSNWQ